MSRIIDSIEQNPIIAAVRDEQDIEDALLSQAGTVFLLHSDIFNVKARVERIKGCHKNALIHIDFVEGLGKDNKAIDYICEVVKPDGIITTRTNHVKYARDKGIFTIQRFFLIDSLSYNTTINAVQSVRPDIIEVMPGVMPTVIKRITREVNIPVIAGGLISTKDDIIHILNSGALGASTAKKELWVL